MERKLKTHKFCPRCSEVKPVSEFYRNTTTYDGMVGYCKKCIQESRLGTGRKHYTGLHKRPFPIDNKCEVCGIKFSEQFYSYHHFDDNNLNFGLWVCAACDFLAEGIDEIDKNVSKVNIYRRLKKEVERADETYTNFGTFSPPNGIHKLFLDGGLSYKWCPHCGLMKPIAEFSKNGSSFDGFQGWCKECINNSHICSRVGKSFRLHKRPKLAYCEICGGKTHLFYHHWDNKNQSKGIWVCQTNKCHHLVEVSDLIDNGSSLLPDKYSRLKQEIIMVKDNIGDTI